MTPPSDTPRVPPDAGAPTPDAGAELRRRLAALVASHGAVVGRDAEARRDCELLLSPLYGGAYAVRTWAVVQALKSGLVDELVGWSHTGAPGGFDDIARRLSTRSGVAQPIAEWALAEWLAAVRSQERPTGRAGEATTPTAAHGAVPSDAPAAAADLPTAKPPKPPKAPRGPATVALDALPGPDVVVRVPHLVLGGLALAGSLVAAAVVWRPPMPGVSVLGEASASTPAMPPAPSLGDAGVADGAARAAACASAGEGGPDRPPRALQAGPVPLPEDAREAGLEDGWATVRARVDRQGRIDAASVEVVDASHPLLASAAPDVAERLRYRPARRDGCAVPATVTRTLRFTEDADPIT